MRGKATLTLILLPARERKHPPIIARLLKSAEAVPCTRYSCGITSLKDRKDQASCEHHGTYPLSPPYSKREIEARQRFAHLSV